MNFQLNPSPFGGRGGAQAGGGPMLRLMFEAKLAPCEDVPLLKLGMGISSGGLGILLSRRFLAQFLVLAAEEEGLMVEVMPGPDDERGVVDEESDILETFDRIKSAELLPMASLEYLMLVYSRVLFCSAFILC